MSSTSGAKQFCHPSTKVWPFNACLSGVPHPVAAHCEARHASSAGVSGGSRLGTLTRESMCFGTPNAQSRCRATPGGARGGLGRGMPCHMEEKAPTSPSDGGGAMDLRLVSSCRQDADCLALGCMQPAAPGSFSQNRQCHDARVTSEACLSVGQGRLLCAGKRRSSVPCCCALAKRLGHQRCSKRLCTRPLASRGARTATVAHRGPAAMSAVAAA